MHPQHDSVQPFGKDGFHARTFLARAALTSTDTREVSARKTFTPRGVIL
jgi:hypothetical protein